MQERVQEIIFSAIFFLPYATLKLQFLAGAMSEFAGFRRGRARPVSRGYLAECIQKHLVGRRLSAMT
jgi:hypothetical protein